VSRLETWARAHAATLRAVPAASGTAADGPVPPPAGPPPPIGQVVVAPEPVLSLTEGGEPGAYAESAVAWCAGAGAEPELATTGATGTRLWDLMSGELIRRFDPRDRGTEYGIGTQRAVAATPSGAGRPLIAAGDETGAVRIWDRETGDLLDSVGSDWVDSLAWLVSGDGRAVLGVGATVGAFLWDEGEAPKLAALSRDGSDSTTVCVASGSDPGGRPLLAVGIDESLAIWDPGVRGRIAVLPSVTGPVRSLAWGHGAAGSLLAVAHAGHEVTIYDTGSNAVLATIDGGERATLYGVCWGTTSDGRLLLATGSSDDTARIWDPLSGGELAVIHHQRDVNAVAFAPAGTVLSQHPGGPAGTETLYLATACDDASSRVYAVHVPALAGLPPAREPAAVAYATGAADQSIALPRQESWAALGVPQGRLESLEGVRFTVPEGPEMVLEGGHANDTVWALRPVAAPDGRVLLASAGQDGFVGVWDLASGQQMVRLECGSPVESLAWTLLRDDRLTLVAAGAWSAPVLWDTGGLTRSLENRDRGRYVCWVTLTDGIPRVVADGEHGTVEIFDPDSESTAIRLVPDDSDEAVASVAGLRAAGRSYVAVGYASGRIRIWDAESAAVLVSVSEQGGQIVSLAWAVAADGRLLLASGSQDHTARIWDALSGECLASMSCEVSVWDLCWAVLADGRLMLATTSATYAVELWDPVRAVAVAQVGDGESGNAGLAVVSPPPDELPGLIVVATSHGDPKVFRVAVEGAERAPGQAAGPPAWPVARTRAGTELESLVSGVVTLGEWGVWGAMGLLEDLIELLEPDRDLTQLADRLNDRGLADLTPDPALIALRRLGWRSVRGRLGLAGLAIAALVPGTEFVPPAGTGPRERAAALLHALSAGIAARRAAPGINEVRLALERMPAGVPMLLEVVGEEAVAADLGLPVRLIATAEVLPVLGPDVLATVSRSVRRMERGDFWLAPAPASGGTLELSQNPADRDLIPVLARRGRPDRMVPTQLALPERVRLPMQATGGLLFRHHADPPAMTPRPVTLVLDVSPAVFGPVEAVLRLVAHLLTTMIWQAGGEVSLVTTARPQVVVPLENRADLVLIWTARSLDPPDLHAAAGTAQALEQPAVLLTHHAIALDQGIRPGFGRAVVTTDTPGAPVPAGPVARGSGRRESGPYGYHRLPPRPAPDELSAVLDALLEYLSGPEAA
jgi:WD40 repeat protein